MSDSLNTSSRALLPYLEQLGTPRALTVAIMLRYKDFGGILSLSTDPRHYDNAERFLRDSAATNLLKKAQLPPPPGIDRRSAALKKWWAGERSCYRTNERLSRFLYGGVSTPEDEAVNEFFSLVRKKILEWLGPKPPDLDEIRGRFGPGATFSDRGRLTTVPDKITSTPTLTASAYWYVLPFMQTAWGRVNHTEKRGLSWVRGNRFLTVPKTGLIDRAIAVEPAINLFYQLGLGSSIRNRLKSRARWDLDRAQDVHRAMAQASSVSREYCTLDLSNASDTVSLELVRLLLPPAWFRELNALRSPFTYVDGRWCKLEKFSSMGNGFTFELETLIFSALMSVLLIKNGRSGRLGEDVFVFGDDILIPDDLASQAETVLRYCGFSLNKEKSFSGSVGFRESCGGDYFLGADVRSYYLKELRNDPWQLIPDYNGFRRTLSKLNSLTGKEDYSGLRGIFSVIPTEINRCRGPKDLGDVVLHTENQSEWRIKWKDGIRYFRCVIRVSRFTPWHFWKPNVVLACAVYGTGDGHLGVLPRDPPFSYKVKWVPLS